MGCREKMTDEIIPDITEFLYNIKKKEYFERLEELKRRDIIYVTDLVYCPKKRDFRIKFPELSFSFDPHLITGEMIHRGLQEILEKKGYEIEKEIEEKIEVNGETITIKGRIDAYSPNHIIEIKTGRTGQNLPHEHHILQLKLYMSITGVKKGTLLYLTSDRMVEYKFELGKSEDILTNIVIEFLKKTRVPRWEWECKLCPYNKLCSERLVQ